MLKNMQKYINIALSIVIALFVCAYSSLNLQNILFSAFGKFIPFVVAFLLLIIILAFLYFLFLRTIELKFINSI